MGIKDCIGEIRAASDGVLSDDEILEMLEEFDAAARAAADKRPWANVQNELFKHAQRLAKDAREAALIERRNKVINQRIEGRLKDFVEREQFRGDPYKALVALSVGARDFGQGSKLSVSAQSKAILRAWMGQLVNELDKAGLTRYVKSKDANLSIAREMWELGREKGKPGITKSKEALEAAKILHSLQERMVARQNRAGAFIRRMPGYIVRQSHDVFKLRKKGFAAWFRAVDGKLDERRTFGREFGLDAHDQAVRKSAYEKIFTDLEAGRFIEAQGEDDLMAAAPFRGGANLAKKASVHRALHFKNADAWYGYNSDFGTGGIMEQVAGAIEHTSRNVALMETFGTNPKLMFDGLTALIDEKSIKTRDAKGKHPKLSKERLALPPDAMFNTISGATQIPGNATAARIMAMVRATQVWSKLGSMVISAIADSPIMAGELRRHGSPYVAGYARTATNLFERFKGKEKRRIATMLGAYSEGVSGDLFQRFDSGDGMPGWVAGANRLFFKANLAYLWTDSHRAGVMRAFSANMADYADEPWQALPDDYRRLLGAFEIGPDDWPKIEAARVEIDGTKYIIPERIGFDAATDAAGRRAARRSRDELTKKLQAFFSDRMDAAVLQPGERERAILLRGSKPGTIEGEFLRAVALFKSFPTTVITRVWGERLAESDYAGLGATVLGMWAMGAMAVAAKDAVKGQAPPDFSDPEMAGKYALRAFVQGGGAGILGDFFLGEYNRYGTSLSSTLVGPVAGQVDSVAKVYAAMIRGEDAGAEAFRAMWNNLPGINLFYARTALNYFLLYPMQEMMNPGYLRRMERRREKDTGQEYFLPPSAAA